MPYSIEWYVEGRVIIEKAYGDVTVEELLRFNVEVTNLIIEKGVPPVHIIADLTKVAHYPSSLREIVNTMRQKAPDKVGWMLVVTESPLLRFAASIIFQLARLRLRMFTNMPDAVKFLGEIDETLATR